MIPEPLRILVVDDDAVDRMAAVRALEKSTLGCEIREARGAAAALAELSAGRFDCLLLDLQLPGVDGLELLKRLRRCGPPCAVVMLTGQGDEQTIVKLMQAGAQDYLAKARLTPETLALSIRQAVRLFESELLHRNFNNALPHIVWTAGADGIVDDFNDKWFAFTGLETVHADGSDWTAALHEEDLPAFSARWSEAVRAPGEAFEAEVRIRRSDGLYRWHLVRARTVLDARGRIVRWFGSCIDVDDHRKAEEERKDLLERERAARSEAEAASRLKDDFLATLSHELRTPLTAVLGWLQMVRSGNLSSEKVGKALETIERNARAQAQLIEDLLDVSRITTGKLRLELGEVDLVGVLNDSLEAIGPAAEARRIRLSAEGLPTALWLRADGARLQQVVWNLLSNAVKFTSAGGRVEVRLRLEEATVRLSVQDDGVGIRPEFLPHVFQRFTQADSSTTRAHGGLGLGLAIVRSLVEMHGGNVSAYSEGLGKGSRFDVEFPLDVLRAGQSRAASEGSSNETPPPLRVRSG